MNGRCRSCFSISLDRIGLTPSKAFPVFTCEAIDVGNTAPRINREGYTRRRTALEQLQSPNLIPWASGSSVV